MEACYQNGAATLDCIPFLFGNVIFAFLLFAGTVALFFLAWGSLGLITSGGDPKKITGARQTMTFAVVGLIIVLSSFSIVYFIGYITGTLECITDPQKIVTGC